MMYMRKSNVSFLSLSCFGPVTISFIDRFRPYHFIRKLPFIVVKFLPHDTNDYFDFECSHIISPCDKECRKLNIMFRFISFKFTPANLRRLTLVVQTENTRIVHHTVGSYFCIRYLLLVDINTNQSLQISEHNARHCNFRAIQAAFDVITGAYTFGPVYK